MILKAGEKVTCSGPSQHECGEIKIDIDSDQIIAPPMSGSGPFSIKCGIKATDHGEWLCPDCGELIARVRNSTYQIHTKHGWVGK